MRQAFHEYHAPASDEVTEIWKNAIIVLDTNVLLDFYCFGKSALDDYYNVLRKARSNNQLWMAYQVGLEFFENRVRIIGKQLDQYDNLIGYLDDPKEKIAKLRNVLPSHAHLDFDTIAKDYEQSVKKLRAKIEKLKKNHPDYLGHDEILDQLEKIFDDSLIGDSYSEKELEEIVKQGEDRYAKKIPPGYRDADKKDDEKGGSQNRKFGDLIIWFQMMKKAKELSKPVIFVTNDAKDDWILYAKGDRNLGPRPSLKREMMKEAGTQFTLYSSDEFLEKARTEFGLEVKAESVNEVKKYRELETARVNALKALFSKRADENGDLIDAEKVHYYIHRGRAMARECVEIARGQDVPERAIRALFDVRELYDRVHHMIDRSTESVITDVLRIERLLVRCRHILEESPFDLDIIRELQRTNRHLLAALERGRF